MSPAGAPIDARVQEVADGTVTLALLSQTREPAASLEGAEVALQFANRRGICRVTGTAQPSSLGEKAIEFVAGGSVEVVQRREYVRVDAVVPVSYKPYGAGGRVVRAENLLINCQRPPVERFRFRILALSTVELRQVVEIGGHNGMLVP